MPRIPACSPPAHSAAPAVVAHPVVVGSGGGIDYRFLRACSLAIARAAFRASFSSLRRFFSSSWKYSLMLPIATMATNAMANMPSIGPTSTSFMVLLVWWLLAVATVVLGCAIFHWVLVPLLAWAVRGLS